MRRLLENEKIRFLYAGLFNTALDFLLLNILVLVAGLYVLIANTVTVLVGVTISYFLNHYFVFRHESSPNIRKFIIFFAITGFSSLVIQSGVIYGFELLTNSEFGRSLIIIRSLADHAALEVNVAKASAVGVGMVWNYLLYKHIVFGRSKSETNID